MEGITLKDISKKYERKIAVSSLSFTIQKGEIVALIGPSGAGKTTLLNILASQIKPDEGQLYYEHTLSSTISDRRQLAKMVGMIRQQFDLVHQLPVIHNVLAGRLADWGFVKSFVSLFVPQEKDLAIGALKRVGLPDKAYELTANLSGGEQQRVALARLLAQNPNIILADEPVASLDPARAEDILNMLVQLAKEDRKTLIASLHSVDLAKKYFDRLIALKDGEILFDLPADQVSDEDLAELYKLKELT